MTATSCRHSGVMRTLLRYAGMAGVEQQLLMMTSDDCDSCLEYAVEASDKVAWPAERQAAPVLAALLDSPFARELVTWQNEAGCTALWHAVTCGHAHAVRALLVAPGGRELFEADGEAALDEATRQGNLDVAEVLAKALFPERSQSLRRPPTMGA